MIALLMAPLAKAVAAEGASAPLTHRLLAALIERHAPTPLFEQADNSWPGGAFAVRVDHAGPAQVTGGGQDLLVELPLKVRLDGVLSQELLQLKLDCKAQFTTPGEVRLTPASPKQLAPMKVQLTVSVPPTMADCGGTQLPVDNYLRAVIQAQKPKWEAELARRINEQL